MVTGSARYRQERGLLWPIDDTECAKVAFDSCDDLDAAIFCCRDRRLAVQAGGNCGVWPLHLAKHFDRVVTFEPCQINFTALVINTFMFDNILALPMALGLGRGWCGLNRIDGNAGAHHVAEGDEAPVMSIDEMYLPACDLIYIDIEGSEHAAIMGALETIGRYRPVIAFEEKGFTERYNVPAGQCEALLQSHGYKVAARRRRDVIMVATDD